MNEKNDKWLDEVISKTINTGKPQFDTEKFKQKFPDEVKIIQSRTLKQPQRLFSLKSIFSDPVASLATAAVLIVTVGLFVFFSQLDNNESLRKVSEVTQTPAEMMSLMSINLAYNRGGLEEVDKQYEKAMTDLGPRPEQLTVSELLAESNGT